MSEPPPPPQLSPLSGAYLLIVVGEPFSEEHKQLILQKIRQGKFCVRFVRQERGEEDVIFSETEVAILFFPFFD
jgi:hypothetical protein